MKKNAWLLTSVLTIISLIISCNSDKDKKSRLPRAQKYISISISSSNPDSTIIFESIYVGEWRGSAPADLQATPFEFTVSSDNFFGSFHKLSGSSKMVVKLNAKKYGETSWRIKKNYKRLFQVVLNGSITSIEGR